MMYQIQIKSQYNYQNLIQTKNKLNHEEIRAVADSKSLRYRFSNKKIFKKYEPKGNIAKKFIIFLKKSGVKKLELAILKELKIILKNFTKKEYQV